MSCKRCRPRQMAVVPGWPSLSPADEAAETGNHPSCRPRESAAGVGGVFVLMVIAIQRLPFRKCQQGYRRAWSGSCPGLHGQETAPARRSRHIPPGSDADALPSPVAVARCLQPLLSILKKQFNLPTTGIPVNFFHCRLVGLDCHGSVRSIQEMASWPAGGSSSWATTRDDDCLQVFFR